MSNDKMILITIEVIMGKWKEKLPRLKDISPGNFPIKVHKRPINIKAIPIKINTFPRFILSHQSLFQSVHRPFA